MCITYLAHSHTQESLEFHLTLYNSLILKEKKMYSETGTFVYIVVSLKIVHYNYRTNKPFEKMLQIIF